MNPCCLVNAGVFIARVSEWSARFWLDVWDCRRYFSVYYYEQSGSLIKYIYYRFYLFNRSFPFFIINSHNSLSQAKEGRVGVLFPFPHVRSWGVSRRQIHPACLRASPRRLQFEPHGSNLLAKKKASTFKGEGDQ